MEFLRKIKLHETCSLAYTKGKLLTVFCDLANEGKQKSEAKASPEQGCSALGPSFLLHCMLAGFLPDHAPQASIRVALNPTRLGFRPCKNTVETNKIDLISALFLHLNKNIILVFYHIQHRSVLQYNVLYYFVYFVMQVVEYSQKPHYTRILPGIVYDSWKTIQFKSSDIKSLEAEFREKAIKQVLDSYKTPDLERGINLGYQEYKEILQKLLDLINQNVRSSYENFWQLIKNDYWNEITKELYNDIRQHEKYENIIVYTPSQQGAVYAGFVIRQTIKYITGFRAKIKIISKGTDIIQKINEDNIEKNLIILVGFSPKFLNTIPIAKIYVIDQTHTDPNVVGYPNLRVISAHTDLLKYYKTYIPIGLLVYRVLYNIWNHANQNIPNELKVICGFSVLSDGK